MLNRAFPVILLLWLSAGAVGQDGFSTTDRFSKFLDSGGGADAALKGPDTATVGLDAELVPVGDGIVELRVTAVPPKGFYLYSMTTPAGQKTQIVLDDPTGLDPVQPGFVPDHAPTVVFSEDFQGNIEKYEDPVTWSRRYRVTDRGSDEISVSGRLRGQICSVGPGGVCIALYPPPEFTATGTVSRSPAERTSSERLPKAPRIPSRVAVFQEGVSASDARMRYVVALNPPDAGPGDTVTLSVTAELAPGWHTYSRSMDPDAGTPTRIVLADVRGLEQLTDFQADREPERKPGVLDGEWFEVHEGQVTWSATFRVISAEATVSGTVSGQACSTVCNLPADAHFTVGLGGPDAVEPFEFAETDRLAGAPPAAPPRPPEAPPSPDTSDAPAAGIRDAHRQGLIPFLVAAMISGFVALLTPCVFPMIPVTVAFFLKQAESGKGSSTVLAVVYCLGIVGSFTIIGVLVSILFGPQMMTELANGPWLNLIFAAVFIAFALMLMGVFEIRVPAALLNWTSKREVQGGLVGVLFMALTFTLVSFTCTTAFVATILVWAAQGNYLWPILGMLAFSAAFASPFFLLALFPGVLARLPASGGWMQKVKSTAGLIELAFVVKFLSVADIGFSPDGMPRFLDFTTTMVLWAALALVTGLYLLGVVRFSKDGASAEGVSPVGGLWGIACVSLSLLICAGLFSPRPPDNWIWDRLAGFAPPRFETADAVGGRDPNGVQDAFPGLRKSRYALVHRGLAYALDLDDALTLARQHNRPVFVDFTGVNCTNCRDMENSVLGEPEILEILATLPRAQLFLDIIPGVTDPKERERLLDENLELSTRLTGGTAMPTYLILSPDGDVLARTSGLVSQEEFERFLQEGLQKFESRTARAELRVPDRPLRRR